MIDLSDQLDRNKLVMQMHNDIDAFCKTEFADDPRTHLGASIIGHECQAYAWNTFRWLKFQEFSGRMLRLFNRGHLEEARFVRWLVGIGFEVREFDPETKKQYRILGAKGHFGGSLDAMMKPPARYNIPDEHVIWLGEFKTHNEKSFAKLAGKKAHYTQSHLPRSGGEGVVKSKPQHYKQMCSYGRAYNFRYGLYCAVNKDTDELYFEIVELDWRQADDLFRKAESIVFSQIRPPKIAMTEAFFDCKYCDFAGLCHRDEVPIKNCRSCKYAFAVEDAQWYCQHPQNTAVIPREVIASGCDYWVRIA
jgi:hypothetical protein